MLDLRSMEHLNRSAHSTLCEGSSTKDLDCLVRAFMSGARSKHLEKPNRASKMRRLLLVWHQSHLVCNVLKPCLVGFAMRDHLRKPKFCEFAGQSLNRLENLLLTDHWLLNELLTKDNSLVAPFYALLGNKSHHTSDATYETCKNNYREMDNTTY